MVHLLKHHTVFDFDTELVSCEECGVTVPIHAWIQFPEECGGRSPNMAVVYADLVAKVARTRSN